MPRLHDRFLSFDHALKLFLSEGEDLQAVPRPREDPIGQFGQLPVEAIVQPGTVGHDDEQVDIAVGAG